MYGPQFLFFNSRNINQEVGNRQGSADLIESGLPLPAQTAQSFYPRKRQGLMVRVQLTDRWKKHQVGISHLDGLQQSHNQWLAIKQAAIRQPPEMGRRQSKDLGGSSGLSYSGSKQPIGGIPPKSTIGQDMHSHIGARFPQSAEGGATAKDLVIRVRREHHNPFEYGQSRSNT